MQTKESFKRNKVSDELNSTNVRRNLLGKHLNMLTTIQILVIFTTGNLETKTCLTGMLSMVDDNGWFLGFHLEPTRRNSVFCLFVCLFVSSCLARAC